MTTLNQLSMLVGVLRKDHKEYSDQLNTIAAALVKLDNSGKEGEEDVHYPHLESLRLHFQDLEILLPEGDKTKIDACMVQITNFLKDPHNKYEYVIEQEVKAKRAATAVPSIGVTEATPQPSKMNTIPESSSSRSRTDSASSSGSSDFVIIEGTPTENFIHDKRDPEIKKQTSNVIKVTEHLISIISDQVVTKASTKYKTLDGMPDTQKAEQKKKWSAEASEDGVVFRESAEHAPFVTESVKVYAEEKFSKSLGKKTTGTRLITDSNRKDFSLMSTNVSSKVAVTPRDAGSLLKAVFKGLDTDVMKLPDADPLNESSVKGNVKLINGALLAHALTLYNHSGVKDAKPNERGNTFMGNLKALLEEKNESGSDPGHIEALKELVIHLPASHLSVFKMLIKLMNEASQYSDVNMLTPYVAGTSAWGIFSGLLGIEASLNLKTAVDENNAIGVLCALWVADGAKVTEILDKQIETRHMAGDYSDNVFPDKQYLDPEKILKNVTKPASSPSSKYSFSKATGAVLGSLFKQAAPPSPKEPVIGVPHALNDSRSSSPSTPGHYSSMPGYTAGQILEPTPAAALTANEEALRETAIAYLNETCEMMQIPMPTIFGEQLGEKNPGDRAAAVDGHMKKMNTALESLKSGPVTNEIKDLIKTCYKVNSSGTKYEAIKELIPSDVHQEFKRK